MPSDEHRHLHAIISGRVQGVSFRAVARRHAQKLGLVGTVSNLPDGTVELYASGNAVQLDALLEALNNESHPIRIDHIDIRWMPHSRHYDGFRII